MATTPKETAQPQTDPIVAELRQARAEIAERDKRLGALEAELAGLETDEKTARDRLDKLAAELKAAQAEVDEISAENQRLRDGELIKAATNACDQLTVTVTFEQRHFDYLKRAAAIEGRSVPNMLERLVKIAAQGKHHQPGAQGIAVRSSEIT